MIKLILFLLSEAILQFLNTIGLCFKYLSIYIYVCVHAMDETQGLTHGICSTPKLNPQPKTYLNEFWRVSVKVWNDECPHFLKIVPDL